MGSYKYKDIMVFKLIQELTISVQFKILNLTHINRLKIYNSKTLN